MNGESRLQQLAEAGDSAWGRPVSVAALKKLIQQELGSKPGLRGQRHAVPVSAVCHVISGNTPQAGLQSLWRGLVAGVPRQLAKLPAAGLPEINSWVEALPDGFRNGIELTHSLPDETLADYPVVAVFGRDETLQTFRSKLRSDQRLLAYGHRFSVGLVLEQATPSLFEAAVRDILMFDQLGCLSLRTIYVAEAGATFAKQLAGALEAACLGKAPGPSLPQPRVAAATYEARNRVRLRMALGEPMQLWQEPSGLPWTVVWNPSFEPVENPLHRFIEVRPYDGDLASALGAERTHLAAVALHPCEAAAAQALLTCRPSRICRFGELQFPPIDWPQENRAPFDGFVQWVEIEPKQPSGWAGIPGAS